MLTLEELMPVFEMVLPRYCNYKYEFWELLNEVWLQGKAQNCANFRFANRTIRSGCIDYIRRCEGRTVNGKRQSKKRLRFRSTAQQIVDQSKPISLGQTLAADTADVGESLQWKEELRLLTAGCSPTQRLMVSMLIEGFSQSEIARVTGYESSRISQICAAYRKTLSARMGRYCADE